MSMVRTLEIRASRTSGNLVLIDTHSRVVILDDTDANVRAALALAPYSLPAGQIDKLIRQGLESRGIWAGFASASIDDMQAPSTTIPTP